MIYSRKERLGQKYTNDYIAKVVAEQLPTYTLLDILQDTEIVVLLQCVEGFEYYPTFRSIVNSRVPRFTLSIHNIQQVCRNHGVTFIAEVNGRSMGNKFRIEYEIDGREFNKLFYQLKELGHTEHTSIDTLPKEVGIQLTDTYRVNNVRWVKGTCSKHGNFNNPWYNNVAVSYCAKCNLDNRCEALRKYSINDVIEHAKNIGITNYFTTEDGLPTITYVCEQGHPPITLTYAHFLTKSTNKCNICTQKRGMVYTEHSIKRLTNTNGLLYVAKFSNHAEIFYKVGISTAIARRFSRPSADYSVELIYTYPMPITQAYTIEQNTLNNYKDYKYTPITHFVGWTECLIASPSELNWFIKKELDNVNL